MSPFQHYWSERAMRFGLSVSIPFSLALDGRVIDIPVLVRQFGARNGMLLVTDYGLIGPGVGRLAALGYGYACLSEPTATDDDEDDEALVDMLRDWGWTGAGARPSWLHEAGA